MDEECFHLAERAIAAFKFPKISRNADNQLEEVDPEEIEEAIPHGYFLEDLTYAEIEILIA